MDICHYVIIVIVCVSLLLTAIYHLVLLAQISHLQKFIKFRSSMGFLDNIVAKCGFGAEVWWDV